MKYLIVNGDDFGISRGVNHGIIEAHRSGILTSASLLVNRAWSEEASRLSRATPDLSVGLHLDLSGKEDGTGIPACDCLAQSQQQLARFRDLTGRLPTHMDAHHNMHRDPHLLPVFLELARRWSLPFRENSGIRYLSKFYGRWGGEQHLESIGVETLVRLLETEIGDGITEIGCHPGYVDSDLQSSYSIEREVELGTLCAPIVRKVIAEQQIHLIDFRDIAKASWSRKGGS